MTEATAAAIERLLAARVPLMFFERLADLLEAPASGGDSIRVVLHRNRGRLVNIMLAEEKHLTLATIRGSDD